MKNRILVTMSLSLCLCGACSSSQVQPQQQSREESQQEQKQSISQASVNEVVTQEDDNEESTLSKTSEEQKQQTNKFKYVVDDEGNEIIIVNKKYSLTSDYAPGEDATAKEQLLKLISEMQQQGFSVSNHYSGYRSYEQQQDLYQNYVSRDGVAEADRYSARPGHSEHQSGLAFDLLDGQGNLLGTASDDGAADWLATHAHDYGFVVRYLPGKESQTGYMPEAWHIRYVGNVAKKLYQSQLTLEEYFHVEGGSQYED